MSHDFSNLQFNQNHRKDSAALEAITGLRCLLVSLAIYIGLIVLLVAAPDLGGLGGLLAFLASVVAFGFGAYGTYLLVDALGWANYLSFILIASFLVPYFRVLSLMAILALGLGLVGSSSYRFSLLGAPKRRAA